MGMVRSTEDARGPRYEEVAERVGFERECVAGRVGAAGTDDGQLDSIQI